MLDAHAVRIRDCSMSTFTPRAIKIKCPVCKAVVAITLKNMKIRTERIGA